MKKKTKYLLSSVLVVAVIFISVFFVKEIIFKEKSVNELINISELSDEFMDDYFEEIKIAKTDEEKENMLIVISQSKVKNEYGAENIIEAPNNQYILQFASEEEKNEALEKLKNDKSIASVEENGKYTTEEVNYNSWGIEKMAIDHAISSSNVEDLQNITVAIIDTGCDVALFNKYYAGKITEVYNVLEESTTSMNDEDGHGTHVAGTIAEGTPSNVKILPIKVSRDGNMYYTDIIAGINYIVKYNKASVINMSFGGYGYNEALDQAIESAKKKNIISVAAAGNDNTEKKHYPSALDNTISIASVDSELNKSKFSNYGAEVTFAAPGTNIKSIMSKDASISKRNGNNDDDDHEIISGTSMATPHAVAAVAILKSYNKELTFDNVIELLKQNSIDLGEKGWDKYYGNGLISFNEVQFCDKTYCDEYGVYKNLDVFVTDLEVSQLKLTKYNYYSLTNLMGTKVNVSYSNGESDEVTLSSIKNLEILNYNPESTDKQIVTIKVGSMTKDVEITNPANYESGWEYNQKNQSEVEITGYKGHDLEIDKLYIPEMINSKKVVSFADDLKLVETSDDFEHYTYLYLPSTFKRIGNYSLSNSNIKYVYGSDNKIEVGAHAFENSQIISIDASLIKIEEYSFKDCYELETIKVWEEQYAWNYGRGLVIGQYAFYNCKKLSSIEMTNETGYNIIGNIEDYAFYNCVSLSNFGLKPGSDIGEYAFYNTFVLFDINLYGSDSIGKFAFYGSGISEARFSVSLETINESSFENCKNLKKVSFVRGRIEKRAFWNSGVETIGISHLTEYISEDAFAYSPVKAGDGIVSSGNYTSDSGVGIVESSTNKLIVGFTNSIEKFSNSKITSNIVEIGEYAFTGNSKLKKITIPSTVVKIGIHAFEDCYNLEDVYMLTNDIQISSESFKRNYEGEIKGSELTFYVYKNSSIKQYAVDNDIKYHHFEPDEYEVINLKDKYTAGTYLTRDDVPQVKLIYKEKETREEIVTQEDSYVTGPISTGFTLMVDYQNPSGGIKYGDTYIKISVKTPLGYVVCTDEIVPINVVKAIPTYTIPTNLSAELFQKLSEIELPSGFEWMDSSQIIKESGEVKFKAKYIPSDLDKYEIVENIDITINVVESRETLVPTITISNKEFDGTSSISKNNVKVNNLSKDEYSIVSVTSEQINVGHHTALVTIRLSDDKFMEYAFDNGKQEKEFSVEYEIVPLKIAKPTSPTWSYVYNGNEITLEVPGFDENTMSVSNNKGTNAGNYEVVVSLKNSNYIWDDETTDDVIINMEISKANISVTDLSRDVTVQYDGQEHTISMDLQYLSTYTLKYMDSNGEYTLDQVPKYKEIGTYKIKYKVSYDNNHKEYLGERTLKILAKTIMFDSNDYEGLVDGQEHTIDINVETENYTIKYSVGNTDYNLNTIPKFKDVGEYTINYKITADGYDAITGSNKVKIYGIKQFDSSLLLKENTIVSKEDLFSNLSSKIVVYSTSSTITHFDKNRTLTNSTTIRTGDIININVNNQKDYEYKISYLGDTSGDGKINYLDYVNVYNHIQKVKHPESTKKLLENEYLMAADMSGDGNITYLDYVKIYNKIKELKGGAN